MDYLDSILILRALIEKNSEEGGSSYTDDNKLAHDGEMVSRSIAVEDITEENTTTTSSVQNEGKGIAGLDIQGGIQVLRDCWETVRRRAPLRLDQCRVKAVTRDGCKDLGLA